MIKSMTGYGKAECIISGSKYIVEIRSLNGKNADINLKTSLIPRDKEMMLRQYLASELSRGSIDLFVSLDSKDQSASAHKVNRDVLAEYYSQVKEAVMQADPQYVPDSELFVSLLHMPDVVGSGKPEIDDDQWETLFAAIRQAVEALKEFRAREGRTLQADVLAKVASIESYIPQISQFEPERTSAVRARLENRLKELQLNADLNRLEQEIIFYIEKLDINEEKVRLAQHCRYFRETVDSEEFPGKKLGFIAQEMGREINTLGSKANHAGIQKCVVRMKDELEKIKEQSMNIL
ncbi:MAG: YicC family protein [Bacteroidales bacterium]|nr:YicC family protein [Bacteroidales bacterium]